MIMINVNNNNNSDDGRLNRDHDGDDRDTCYIIYACCLILHMRTL